jgi:hypothetical protein
MAYWWDALPDEKYWVEITDRSDIGTDLKCPQTNERGRSYWSYSLIRSIWPGDIVYHYSTRKRCFVGASVAGGPLEERPIVWIPHGTYGRSKEIHTERPGWWLPLYGYSEASSPLTLLQVQEPVNQSWFLTWLERMKHEANGQIIAAPFQPYPDKIRAQQGYLTKMPAVFLDRWASLSNLAESLAQHEDVLVNLAEVAPATSAQFSPAKFVPKSDQEYSAVIRASVQRRSRHHERLLKTAADFLEKRGASVCNPHPIDLLMLSPLKVIIEAKLVLNRSAGFAIREALGQLFEYRHFIGPQDAKLCILLDKKPQELFVNYVEVVLGFQILWFTGSSLTGGPKTLRQFAEVGLSLGQIS